MIELSLFPYFAYTFLISVYYFFLQVLNYALLF